MPNVTFVVVAFEPGDLLERCLENVAATGVDAIVVDNASTDGSAGPAERRFPHVTFLRLDRNCGFGTAANEGIQRAAPDDVVLLNADAWPLGDGFDALQACAARQPRAGILGPRLVGADGSPQASEFGFPTRWWTGRPAVSSWPRRAGSRLGVAERRFVVGAALFLRRAALDEVGLFDERFFLFNEEVDLAWRMWQAGWTVELCARSRFVHVGGSATRRDWPAAYRQQLRSHLLFLAKHEGLAAAEQARRFLVAAIAARAVFARGDRRSAFSRGVRWLASTSTPLLLERPADTSPGRSAEPEDGTARSAD